MSPERWGDLVGVSGQTVRRIEDNLADLEALHPETRRKIALGLGCETDAAFRELWS